MKSIRKIRNLLQLGGTEGIAKRYLVMNSFDGALTALGIILGNLLVAVSDPSLSLFTLLNNTFSISIQKLKERKLKLV